MLDWDTVALLDGRSLDERMMGGRVLDWDTVALLDGRLLENGRGGECYVTVPRKNNLSLLQARCPFFYRNLWDRKKLIIYYRDTRKLANVDIDEQCVYV